MALGELDRVKELLETANSGECALFVAGVAERHLAAHEALPPDQQIPFIVGLRPLMNDVWIAVCGNQTVFRDVARGLAEFYLSPYFDNEPADDLDGIDSSVAGAVITAAECYLHKCVHFALRAMYFGVNAAVEVLDTQGISTRRQRAEIAHQRAEIARQVQDLELIRTYANVVRGADQGLSFDVIDRLERELRPRLSA